jgi:prepilin-type N-terminal cleavage/methylation domain-containing protein
VLTVRAPERRRAGDDGYSLIEVITAMAVLSVLLLVFGRAVMLMTSTTSRVIGNTNSATQVRQATDVLSRQLAVAGATNTPVWDSTSGKWYLEFQTDAVLAGKDSTCTRWRYTPATGVVDYQTWSTVALVGSSWFTVARNVVNDPVTQPPFTVYPSDTGFSLPRVGVDLVARTNQANRIETEGQYTLRNAAAAAPPGPSTVCTQVARS